MGECVGTLRTRVGQPTVTHVQLRTRVGQTTVTRVGQTMGEELDEADKDDDNRCGQAEETDEEYSGFSMNSKGSLG